MLVSKTIKNLFNEKEIVTLEDIYHRIEIECTEEVTKTSKHRIRSYIHYLSRSKKIIRIKPQTYKKIFDQSL